MSFFYDVLKEFEVEDFSQCTSINYIENKGAVVVGNFKILTLNDSLICLKSQKNLIQIEGENLSLKTISKGEIVVVGKIFLIKNGGVND